jgi:hypothetical protein
MNKRPGHVTVTIEQGYCSFCDRTRNLRREEHLLGALVRTVVTCETCHRKLASTIGVAGAEQPATAVAAAAAQAAPVEAAAEPVEAVSDGEKATVPAQRASPKATTKAKTASKPKTTAKPKTATRITTRRK